MGGRELQREREAVEAAGDGREGGRRRSRDRHRGPRGGRPVQEHLHGRGGAHGGDVVGGGHRQRVERQGVLGPDAQRGPAGGEHPQAGAATEQLRHLAGRVEDVLEVVEDEQVPPVPQRRGEGVHGPPALLHPAHGARHRGQDQARVGERGQLDHRDRAGEVAGQRPGHREGEPGLPDPAGAGQREQPHPAGAEEGHGPVVLGLAAQERGRGDGEGPGGRRRDGLLDGADRAAGATVRGGATRGGAVRHRGGAVGSAPVPSGAGRRVPAAATRAARSCSSRPSAAASARTVCG